MQMKPTTWPGTDIPISRGNGFDWLTGQPSIFLSDPKFNQNARTSQIASQSVAIMRAEGRDNSTIPGLSVKADELIAVFKKNNLSIDPEPQQSADKTQRIKKGGI